MKRLIWLILCIPALLAGCTGGSSFTRNSVENATGTSWMMRYEEFDGNKFMTVSGENEEADFSVEIVTEDGSLSLSITGADGTEYYEGSALPSSEFTVHADKSGPYTICFEADHHRGSFAVTWE
jgi:hypothetical protein